MKKWTFPKVEAFCLICVSFISVSSPFRIHPPASSNVSAINPKIVGGFRADIQKYPYQVSMQYSGRHICGASILSNNFVITAAHCTYKTTTSRITFRAGSSTRSQGGQVVKAKTVSQHPKFNFNTVDYDVAVVEVIPTFTYNNRLKNIAIGTNEPREGTLVTASGWGTITELSNRIPNELRAVEVPVISRTNCRREYFGQAVITARMICAGLLHEGGKDTCQGDSGGPLVSNGNLVGVVSWGFGCGRYKYPGVYTNICNREIRSFLRNVTGIALVFPLTDIDKIRGSRIVGGEDTTIEQFPHQASLHFFHTHICGASIISPTWLITAAHCTTLDMKYSHTPIRAFTVRIGTSLLETGGQEISVLKVFDHPTFLLSFPIGYDYDISLLYLEADITFSATVQPIRLPEPGEIYSPGTTATVIGWGLTHEFGVTLSEVLQKLDLPLISNENCDDMYSIGWGIVNHVTDRMICAGFVDGLMDACGGDSGGPLIVNNTLVGVVSWGNGCARAQAPGVYSDVIFFRNWIKHISGV